MLRSYCARLEATALFVREIVASCTLFFARTVFSDRINTQVLPAGAVIFTLAKTPTMLTSEAPIRVVIADDHELLREGLRQVLASDPSIQVEGLAANGAELVDLVARVRPQVVLTDIVMPILDGVAATRRIIEMAPDTGIVALSTFDSPSMVIEMLRAGACGYLLKNVDRHELIEAIHAASRQEEYFCRVVAGRLAQFVLTNGVHELPGDRFDERELAVIRCICEEHTTEEIAQELFIAKRTVDGIRARILSKMRVRSTAGLVLYALLHGLYRPKGNLPLPELLRTRVG